MVLGLTLAFTAVEIVGGILTGSLALLADAVHMLSDNVALALALFAVWLAGRPSTPVEDSRLHRRVLPVRGVPHRTYDGRVTTGRA